VNKEPLEEVDNGDGKEEEVTKETDKLQEGNGEA
jgi:hypothetical protein